MANFSPSPPRIAFEHGVDLGIGQRVGGQVVEGALVSPFAAHLSKKTKQDALVPRAHGDPGHAEGLQFGQGRALVAGDDVERRIDLLG